MRSVPTALLLLLSRTCLDLHTSTTGYLACLLSEQFQLLDQANLATVNQALTNVSQAVLDSYAQALNLQEIITTLLRAIADSVRNSFDTLQTFLDPELSFSAKTYFRTSFCISMVQEGVLMTHF